MTQNIRLLKATEITSHCSKVFLLNNEESFNFAFQAIIVKFTYY